MPEDRLRRAKGTLPFAYQFGDARWHGRFWPEDPPLTLDHVSAAVIAHIVTSAHHQDHDRENSLYAFLMKLGTHADL